MSSTLTSYDPKPFTSGQSQSSGIVASEQRPTTVVAPYYGYWKTMLTQFGRSRAIEATITAMVYLVIDLSVPFGDPFSRLSPVADNQKAQTYKDLFYGARFLEWSNSQGGNWVNSQPVGEPRKKSGMQ